ncbi:HAD family phosphatase [Paracoccus sediminis]|uniref:HAD family phosphatase n=1 Tax=Paracoccus sediminis TaxID=1214787 RepID=A0A238XIP4_9RHOB|nr:HAD family phosphatase [Paracoccus sediminis]TBN48469.1 HAD family phosphatase [Paracoccus sediminis]SNR57819.1 haloacid dehalogenase superfamily, subfamily IA, variant 3 with third motif having DD or ED [Paracoccus sediminis]
MTSIRAVIFDMDGCLVDSEPMSLETLGDMMGAEGLPTTRDELRQRFLGVSIQAIVRQIGEALGRDDLHDFAATFEERLLARYPSELRLIPGICGLLDDLAARDIAVAIATGSSVRRLGITLRVAGLADRFGNMTFSADQVNRGKPAPDLFLLAAERLGVRPDACAVMEDSPHGIAGARAAGMRAVGFTGGSHLHGMQADHARRLREAGAAAVLPDLAGMADALLDRQATGV